MNEVKSKYSILYVEDNDAVRENYVNYLKRFYENEVVNSINEEAQEFDERKGIKRFDPQKMEEEVR
ncbi:MAG: hypothetical protein FAF04_06930 [Epsilonproteobacteria bacterium]|nr:hypothetical protein [Campylobacterota bacterium]